MVVLLNKPADSAIIVFLFARYDLLVKKEFTR